MPILERQWWWAGIILCVTIAAFLLMQPHFRELLRTSGALLPLSSNEEDAFVATALEPSESPQPLARLGYGRASQIVFNAQGTRVAISTDLGLYLYDAATFSLIHFWETETPVQQVAFSADGGELAFSTMNEIKTLYRYVLDSDESIMLDLDESLMHGLAYSPDGRYLIGLSFYHLFIWDADSLELLASHEQPAALTKQIAFSPDSELLAILYKKTMALWKLEGIVEVATATLSTDGYFNVDTATFTPDGRQIFVGDLRNPLLYSWQIDADGILAEEPFRELRSSDGAIADLQVDLAGEHLAVGFVDGAMSVLPLPLSDEPTIAANADRLEHVAWSSDSTLIAAGVTDGALTIWESESLTLVQTLPLPVYATDSKIQRMVMDSLDNTLTAVNANGAIYRWSITDGELIQSLEQHNLGRINSVAFADEGNQLFVGAENSVVQIWDWRREALIDTYHTEGGEVDAVVPAPSGDQFVVAASDSLALGIWADPITLWASDADAPMTLLDTDDAGFITTCGIYWNNATFSPDGQSLLTTAYAHKALLWDVENGVLLHEFTGHESAVLDIALSPNGEFVATASDDEDVRIWRTEDGTLQETFSEHAGGAVAIAFTMDGQGLLSRSAFGDVTLWPLGGGDKQTLISDVRNPRSNLVYSPDGDFLASGGRGNSAYLWLIDKETSEPVSFYQLEGHNGVVNEVAFSPDGALLATASDDGTVVLWEVPHSR